MASHSSENSLWRILTNPMEAHVVEIWSKPKLKKTMLAAFYKYRATIYFLSQIEEITRQP